MTNLEIAKLIIELVGGKNNIIKVENCMTRCRMDINDLTLCNLEDIKKINGVMGIVVEGNYLQIILGLGKAEKVVKEIKKITFDNKIGDEAVNDIKSKLKEKNNTKFKNILKKLGNIFIPLIPLFISCGLILAINNILNVYVGSEYKELNIAKIISILGNGVFGILPILVGVNAAKEFGSSMPMMGGVIASVLTTPALSNVEFLGKNLTAGRGGIISVVLVVFISIIIEKNLKKIIPEILDLFLTPLLTLIMTFFIAIIFIQPLGGIISDSIGIMVKNTISSDNIFISVISGAISGSLFLPLVMTGMHQALTPIHVDLINNLGYTTLLPILATAGMAQVGASIAVLFKTKNNNLKKVVKNALIPGILGVGEPLIYGVTLPLGKPFLGACLGAGVGGAVMAFFKVGAVALGVSGLPLALLISEGKTLVFLLGVLSSYVAGYLFTSIIGFDDLN